MLYSDMESALKTAKKEINRLTAELEAWRSGRLDHYGDRFALALDEHNLFKSDNIDILVDMLMAEQEEVTP
jgi:hypothetical protein